MFRGLFHLFAGAVLASAAMPGVGAAQSNPFQRLVGREDGPRAQTVLYERADARGRFVFDRSASPALIYPEDSGEVIAVWPSRASGGGEVWVADTGRVVLRFSNLGGATYFPPGDREGVIADPVGEARPLSADPASARELQDAARAMVDALARRGRVEVRAELTELGPAGNAYIVDTTRMVIRAAEDTPRRRLRDLETVRIGVGEAPRASFSGGVLDISVDPSKGYGGRPSSDFIERVLEEG